MHECIHTWLLARLWFVRVIAICPLAAGRWVDGSGRSQWAIYINICILYLYFEPSTVLPHVTTLCTIQPRTLHDKTLFPAASLPSHRPARFSPHCSTHYVQCRTVRIVVKITTFTGQLMLPCYPRKRKKMLPCNQ